VVATVWCGQFFVVAQLVKRPESCSFDILDPPKNFWTNHKKFEYEVGHLDNKWSSWRMIVSFTLIKDLGLLPSLCQISVALYNINQVKSTFIDPVVQSGDIAWVD